MQKKKRTTVLLYLRPRLPPITGLPKCSGCVSGSWSNVSLSLKCRPLFRHNALRRNVVMSPSSNTTVYCEQSWIFVMVASTNSFRSGCFTSTVPPTRNKSLLICSSETVPDPPTQIGRENQDQVETLYRALSGIAFTLFVGDFTFYVAYHFSNFCLAKRPFVFSANLRTD